MRETNFKGWLEQQQYKPSTIATQLSSARSIEQAYGDLDELYDHEGFDGLVREFTYSAADRAANRPNPTKLKLWGNTYRDLAHLRATLSYYKSFKEGRVRRGLTLPDRAAVEKAMDECEQVGAVEFAEVYGFSWSNVEYYAVRAGIYFPAKAIFAVAHQYMPSGVPLDSKTSDGTEAHKHLASLGFEIAKRGPVVLFDNRGEMYEPVPQTNRSTGRSAYRYRPEGASNRTEEAVETVDIAELCRALFIKGLPVRISSAGGGPANYLTYPGQKFSSYWLRPDIAVTIGLGVTANQTREQRQEEGETILSLPSNLILYGPPGTGKTWRTAQEAVRICDGVAPSSREELMARYRELQAQKRIAFVTFHQSMDYESFVEGLRPETKDSDTEGTGFRLEARPGIFREICSLAEQARRAGQSAQESPFDIGGRQFWKMGLGAIGTEDDVYEGAIAGDYIVLGWGGEIDWSAPRFENAAEVEKEWKAKNPGKESPSNYTQLWPFRARMKKGDIVVVPYGNTAFRAIAEVTGDYQYVPSEIGTYNHRRNVRWLLKLAEPLPLDTIIEGDFTMRTLYPILEARLKMPALKRLLVGDSRASEGRPDQFVLIIDEINRANVSKVLGELITLIEPDKRLGQPNALEVVLPYSRKPFGVPDNLHIVGTMNTADRSIALLDTALRRRFKFVEVEPDPSRLEDVAIRTGLPLALVLQAMNDRIEYLLDRDHRIGHAFFVDCQTRGDVDRVMLEKVIPLLQEYFFEDWGRVAAVLGEQTEPSSKLYHGSFLECRRLGDPTGNGAVDRLSWSVRRRSESSVFSEEAYHRLVSGNARLEVEEAFATEDVEEGK